MRIHQRTDLTSNGANYEPSILDSICGVCGGDVPQGLQGTSAYRVGGDDSGDAGDSGLAHIQRAGEHRDKLNADE